jgi:hypothetical protein
MLKFLKKMFSYETPEHVKSTFEAKPEHTTRIVSRVGMQSGKKLYYIEWCNVYETHICDPNNPDNYVWEWLDVTVKRKTRMKGSNNVIQLNGDVYKCGYANLGEAKADMVRYKEFVILFDSGKFNKTVVEA